MPWHPAPPDGRVHVLDDGELRDGQEGNVSWMTAINLTAGQVHVVRTGGRRRGPIDNPTLNTLNNQEDEVATIPALSL